MDSDQGSGLSLINASLIPCNSFLTDSGKESARWKVTNCYVPFFASRRLTILFHQEGGLLPGDARYQPAGEEGDYVGEQTYIEGVELGQ